MTCSVPQTIEELLHRAHALAGRTLADVARSHDYPLPVNPKREKGWTGQLLEHCLGATAKSRAEPDFPHLGVELKTLPVTKAGQPAESTYVCTVPLGEATQLQWEACWVRQKLKNVLWFPVQHSQASDIAQRRLGTPFLWQPGEEEELALRSDWEELTDMICRGELHKITARHGNFLQIRPKAANSRAVCLTSSDTGDGQYTLPRGFYLRTCFTANILRQFFN